MSDRRRPCRDGRRRRGRRADSTWHTVSHPPHSQAVGSGSSGRRPPTHGTVFAMTASADRRAQIALAALVAATATLYLWNLSATGYVNLFYAAAAQARAARLPAVVFCSLVAPSS